jgi:hypothetical protein
MKLDPIETAAAPAYPSIPRCPSWARRAAVALGTTLALGSLGAGCAGPAAQSQAPIATAISGVADGPKEVRRPAAPNRNIEWCQPALRLSGDRSPARHFTCGAAPTNAMPIHDAPPGVSDGELCGDQPAWARFRVTSATRTSITLQGTDVKLSIFAPDGSPVAEVGPQRQCVALDMEPGVWVLSASPAPGSQRRTGYFEFFFDRGGSP